MKKVLKTVICIVLVTMLFATNILLVACKPNITYYDNEKNFLVFSLQDVDGVFNPFFSTSGTDSSVVGLTQIGMIGNDKEGKPVVGEDEAVAVLDYEVVKAGEGKEQTSTYYFVLKNNVRFSNGSYMTIKDVLFNLYVYLDPAYTGSSTIYSTDIVGLKQYRTQEDNENEQDNFRAQFEDIADGRMSQLLEALDDIDAEYTLSSLKVDGETDELKVLLEEYKDNYAGHDNIVKDYLRAIELFKEELQSDYSASKDSYKDMVFKDDKDVPHKDLFTTDVEVFLYNEGYIQWSKKDAQLTSYATNDVTELKSWTEERAINYVFGATIPGQITDVIQYWGTAVELYEEIVLEAMGEFFKGDTENKYPNISGIRFANGGEDKLGADSVTVNGKAYPTPTYNEDGSVASGNEVLSIQIKGIDPKAIWNFAFAVAPMYYYSDAEHINKFDFKANFGVERGAPDFMNNVVGSPAKNQVPVGAGPYAASKASGGITGVTNIRDKGVIYYERNPYFIKEVTIKSIRYQVVSTTQQLDALFQNQVQFAEPSATSDTLKELNQKKKEGNIDYTDIRTSGYGYIGINAGKVPNIKVRQAIMHSINTMECVDYYETNAQQIHRSMSMASWAYPQGCTAYYPYIGGPVPADLTKVNPDYRDYVTKLNKKTGDTLTTAEQDAFIKGLIEGQGYTVGGDGIYVKGSDKLSYEFAIAGQETDHPAYNAMLHAKEVLERNGFKINLRPRQDALKQLATGGLTVWAAAWGSTIDPDMYQVYHKDSTATSVLNWGYKQILLNAGNKYAFEYKKVNDLSKLIDEARKIDDSTDEGKAQRASLYSRCLDMVMELAVELPTYQRNDLFAYNAKMIDASTFTPEKDRSPFKGLTSDIHNLSLIVER